MGFAERDEARLPRCDQDDLACFRHSETDGRQYCAKGEGEQVLQVRADQSKGGHRRPS